MEENFMLNTYTVSAFALGSILGYSVSCILHKSFRGKSTDRNNKETSTIKSGDETIIENLNESLNGYPKDICRMIIGVRTDLKMSKGKVAAQVAHAAVSAYIKASNKAPKLLKSWSRQGQGKITVKLEDEEEMLQLASKAKEMGILVSIIRDAGHTQVEPDTMTVVAFGPAPKELLDQVTGHLKLY